MKNLFHKNLSDNTVRSKAAKKQKDRSALSDPELSDVVNSKLSSEKKVHPATSDRGQYLLTEGLSTGLKVPDSCDFVPTGNFLLTKDGKIAGLNLNGTRLLHQGKTSLKGSLFESFVSNDTKSIFKDFVLKVYNNQGNIPCEITLSITGHAPMYVYLTGSLRKNKELCLITAINITERKQTEIMLQQERKLYQDIINNQPAGIYRIRISKPEKWWKNAWKSSANPPYCMELASDRFCEILGITRKEFEDNPAIIADLIHPQDLSEFSIKNEEANSRIIPFRWEGRIVIHGKISWIHLESSPRPLATGEVLWTGILYDITDQKNAKEELKASENKYRELVDKLPDAVTVYSEGKIVFVNKECLLLLAAKNKEELIGKPVIDFIHPDCRALALKRMKDMKSNGKVLPVIEEKLIRLDGSVIDVEIKTMPILFQNEPAAQSIILDITERKGAELKIKESRENFIDLFDNAPIGYHEIDMEGHIVRMNQTELSMLGYTSEDVLGHYIWSLVSSAEVSREETKKKLSGELETSEFYEREFCRKDGKLLSVLLKDKLLKDADGHIYGNRTTVQDITERKQSELKLQLSEERFRNIFENSLIGKSITTQDGRLSVNKAFSQMVGYTEAELSKMHWLDFTCKEDIEFNKKETEKILNGEKYSSHWEKRFIHKNGNLIWADISTFLLRDQEGQPVHFITEVYDITERKQAEAALQASEEKYRFLFANNPQPMYIYDMETLAFLEVNMAAVEHYGYTKEEFLSMTLKDIRPPEDIPALLMDVQDNKASYKPSGEWRHIKKDGEMIFVDITTVSMVSNGKRVRYVLVQDITERRRAENALKESVSLLNATIESTEDGILVVGMNGSITLFNQRYADMWKIPKDLFYNNDDEPMLYYVSSQVKKSEAFLNKVRHLYENPELSGNDQIELLDGRVFDRYSLPHKIGDDIVGRVWSFRDITLSKIAEEALRISEDKFRSITEQIGDLIAISDNNGIIKYASPAAKGLFQYEPEEMIGLHFIDFIHEDSIPITINAFRVGADNKKKAVDVELKLKRKDGSVFFGELNGTEFSNGDLNGRLVVLHDITSRKQAIELLQESEGKFRSMAEQINDLIAITDDKGCILYASPASKSLFNMESNEMCGHFFTDFLDEESIPKATAAFRISFKENDSVYNLELKIKRKDGSLFYGELNGTIFEHDGNKQTLVVIRDISERMRAQEEIEKKMNELIQFQNLTVDRELTMIELKKEVNRLLRNTGENEKYKIVD